MKRIIESVLIGCVFVVVVVCIAAGVCSAVLREHNDDVAGWVSDSYDAFKGHELTTKDFDVQMSDTKVCDVFTVFPSDDRELLTAQTIAAQWDQQWEHFVRQDA